MIMSPFEGALINAIVDVVAIYHPKAMKKLSMADAREAAQIVVKQVEALGITEAPDGP